MSKCCNNETKCNEKTSQATDTDIATPLSVKGVSFKIHGMDCAEEVSALRSEVEPIVGGSAFLAFDILNGKMTVLKDDIPSEKIRSAVARTGMIAEDWERVSKTKTGGFWLQHGRNILTAMSGILVLFGFLADILSSGSIAHSIGAEGTHHVVSPLARLLYGLAIVAGGRFIVPKAFFALKRLRPDMNLLMTIAVIGALFIGEWFEAATVSFLFALSLTLESWSVGRARKAVAALMDLVPPTVRLLDDQGNENLVPPEQVSVGAVFIVKTGDRIALDGTVIQGQSQVNQSPITGESLPVAKHPGDDVFAGTINGDGVLHVRSSKPPQDTTLSNIIRMVSDAQSRRAPAEQWVEKFARIYTPAIVFLALVVLLLPPLLLNEEWGIWLYRSLVLLVIGCPCALVISTPVSIVAAIAAAARNGILIKGGTYIEIPATLKAIAIDKTGTLTTGKPSVVDVVSLNGYDKRQLLERAAALEAGSTHPLAQAILAYARQQEIQIRQATNYQIIPGKGAQGDFDGEKYWLGSHRFLEEMREETEEIHRRLELMAAAGCTVVVIGNSRHVCGFITLTDTVRTAAKTLARDLRKNGIEHIVMLTGDNKGTAEAVAREANIDTVYAELLPQDKVQQIETLVDRYGQVAMVGDGVNDAPAMARATLAIAMGAVGSDAAIETADIALMSDDLSKLSWLISHSRRTMMIIRQNIVFALSIKAIFVMLTFTGFASLWAAIAADMGASLLVVFNGLRLLKTE